MINSLEKEEPKTKDKNLNKFVHQVNCNKKCCLALLKSNILLGLLLLGIIGGICLGVGLKLNNVELTDRELMYFSFPGELFMRILKCLILPLIVGSLISGIGGIDVSSTGRIGLCGILYYLCTTVFASCLGILLVSTIRPGERATVSVDSNNTGTGNVADSFLDLLRNMFPDNIVEACLRQTGTIQLPVMKRVLEIVEMNVTDPGRCMNNSELVSSYNIKENYSTLCFVEITVQRVDYYDFEVKKEFGMNILGVVVFSIGVGIVLSQMGSIGRPLYLTSLALAEATMKMLMAFMWYSPIGVMFLVASQILEIDNAEEEIRALGLYLVTVIVGLVIHSLIILPLLFLVVCRRNPYKYLLGMLQAVFTAFGISSSSATLPVTLRCLEENNGVDPRVTRMLLPVGAVINMDGTALYEAVAAIFIAQSNGIMLNPAQIVTTSITATLASISAATIPHAGLVTMVMVLSAIGLPAEEVMKVAVVDWVLDRLRTVVNIEGDAIGAAIVNHLCRKQLAAQLTNKLPAMELAVNQQSNCDNLEKVNCLFIDEPVQLAKENHKDRNSVSHM